MASINISITRKIYDKLKQLKYPNESFSNVIDRLIATKKTPFDFEGLWEDWEFADKFEEGIKMARIVDVQKDASIIDQWDAS